MNGNDIKLYDEDGVLRFVAAPEPPDTTGKVVVSMRFDAQLLARVDAAAKRQGISRTAWLHVASSKALEE
jgi:hypothetical protein